MNSKENRHIYLSREYIEEVFAFVVAMYINAYGLEDKIDEISNYTNTILSVAMGMIFVDDIEDNYEKMITLAMREIKNRYDSKMGDNTDGNN